MLKNIEQIIEIKLKITMNDILFQLMINEIFALLFWADSFLCPLNCSWLQKYEMDPRSCAVSF